MNTDVAITGVFTDRRRIFILPIGSLEQHGPYLPIDTDLRIAQLLAQNLASLFNGTEALLLPAIPFSSSWEHKGPGTIALNVSTLSAILHDVAYSLEAWKTHSLLILVNWHGGNSILGSLATEITARENIPTAVIPSPSEVGQIWRTNNATTVSDVHAGAIETSVIQAYWPNLIHHPIQANDHYEPDIQPAKTQAVLQSIGIRTVSKTGIWGAPEQANATKGRELIEKLTDSMFKQTNKILQLLNQCEEEK
ncbi:creatinine amidohydrolase [Dictyobacter alpinus]|uniref:Creatinine amidohydrolase n=1 Tax=Dictyobacter alpinus TaxID=2014873 RepID=A0A402B6S7_9CHLR|nr:creatininase family protein [Dictyobacter alpinus]GCE27055.1 creatinine amidohydrolase [Dictyobacter alpinus]